MEIEYTSGARRIIYDKMNARVRKVELKCHECGEWEDEDDMVWINPDTGEATVENGLPYHTDCAPDIQVGYVEGKCPKCNEDLIYDGAAGISDEQVFYPVKCSNCDYMGNEWYELHFVEQVP